MFEKIPNAVCLLFISCKQWSISVSQNFMLLKFIYFILITIMWEWRYSEYWVWIKAYPEQQPQCKFRVDNDHSVVCSPCLKLSVAQGGFKQKVIVLYLVAPEWPFFSNPWKCFSPQVCKQVHLLGPPGQYLVLDKMVPMVYLSLTITGRGLICVP